MSDKPASLHVVGLGPGNADLLSPLALKRLAGAETIAGYDLYVKLLDPGLLKGKKIISTGMRGEEKRCRAAVEAALSGSRTAVISSGDAGVYGMAGLVHEILEHEGLLESLPVEVIPGIPAVCAAAAILGAPLTHDFACVSLSDLLTPWEKIVSRLHGALSADFVLAIYNPKSRGRSTQLAEALTIARKYRSPDCPVGLVRNACREGQSCLVCGLDEFDPQQADMLSIIIIGNESTRMACGKMITPRGYSI